MVMDVNYYLTQMQNLTLEQILGSSDFSLGSLNSAAWITLVILVLGGILWCFFGLKLVRVWSAILGLVLGFGIGSGVAAAFFDLEPMVILIIGIVLGIVFACLGAILYRVGIFLVAWVAGTSAACTIIVPANMTMALVCLAIGLVIALLTLAFAEPVAMVVTGVHGAMILGNVTSLFIPVEGEWVRIVAIAVFALLGIWLQFVMESGKRKKRSLKKAKEIREQQSTENEVEKARAVIDNLDSVPEEEEDRTEDEDETDDDDDITYINL